MSTAPQPTPAGKPDARRSLLTILGGLSLAFCSYVAFFSFPGQGVVESVGQHARAKALAAVSKDSEHEAVHADYEGRFRTLIDVACAEKHGGKEHAKPHTAGPGYELLLQVAAENGLLANAR